MPRSRSSSLESMTRLTTAWLSAEDAALVEHGVHQRGLAVVHVGDDGDVADVSGHRGHKLARIGCALVVDTAIVSARGYAIPGVLCKVVKVNGLHNFAMRN